MDVIANGAAQRAPSAATLVAAASIAADRC